MRRFSHHRLIVFGFTAIIAVTGIFADVAIDDFERGYVATAVGTPWYFFDDSANGGNSKVNNAGPGNTFAGEYGPGNGSLHAAVMEFTLGGAYDFPYVVMGFPFSNDSDHSVDMTGATAVRFDIKASRTMSIRVEIAQSTIADYNFYHTNITVGTAWTTVTVNLATGSGGLHQDDWGDPAPFDLEKLSFIKWFYQDYENGSTGTISVDNVVIIGDPVGLQTPPPYPPVPALPASKAVDVDTAPTLVWHPSLGATGYRLQIAASETFGTCFLDAGAPTDTVMTVAGLARGAAYFWRVKAYGGADTGGWSSTGVFTTRHGIPPVPVPTAPADGATAVPVSALLSWGAATGAATYNLQLSTSPTFSPLAADRTGLTAVSYTVDPLGNGTAYYWRVNATNAAGTSAWSVVRGFTTIQAPPPAPTLLSPADGAVDADTAGAFIWNAATGAATYTLQVATASSFATYVVNRPGIIDTTAAASLGAATRYYWRVRALSSDGSASVSAVRSFTTKTLLPPAPSLTTPLNGAVDVPVSVTVGWSASAGAASYDLELSNSPDFATTIVNRTGITTTSASLSALDNSMLYYVRVRAVNTAGASAWSAVRSFSTVAPPPPTARLSYFGFYTNGSKRTVVRDAADSTFQLKDSAGGVLFTGTLGAPSPWAPSGDTVRIADFSSFKSVGAAALFCGGRKAVGGDFSISPQPLRALLRSSLKAYYYQRASLALASDCAGSWARPAGHPDTAVTVHSSAGSGIISSPKGWYDAGDYGKYIISSGITVYTMLALDEHFPAFMAGLSLGIPESDNAVPDILDEARWNLEWMLSMQAEDGGVYSKLTPLQFDGFIMPDKSVSKRYVFMKTTPSALDFAAVTAMSSRLYSAFDAPFAGRCLEAAKKAYAWASANPAVRYVQPTGCNTGEYGDTVFSDEFFWASAELALATKSGDYTLHKTSPLPRAAVPDWQNVSTLGLYTMAANMQAFPKELGDTARARLLAAADMLLSRQGGGYGVSMASADFYWGSNHVAASQGVLLMYAYLLTEKTEYLVAAQQQIDYLTGRNPLGRCFVTGFGALSPQHPHHRISQADGVSAPVPGFLVGGPNPNREDAADCGSYGGKPATSWLDDVCSYASNEVAINWNAPLVYLAGTLEAVYGGEKVVGFRRASTGARSGKYSVSRMDRITLLKRGGFIHFQCPAPPGVAQPGIFRMFNVSGKRILQAPLSTVSGYGEMLYAVKLPADAVTAGYVVVCVEAGGKRLQRSFFLP